MQNALEKYAFQPSPEPTIGVELELPIVDRESGQLAPGSPRILEGCREERLDNVSAELMQSQLEVRTGICRSIREVQDDLATTLRRARNIADSLGYDLALLASHPSARASEHVIFHDDHYVQTQARLAWLVYHRVTFGLHIHVGVRSGDEAIGLINMLVQYLPHLIAASANSPFWQGVDTGLASSRSALYGLVTHAGVPLYFSKWRDFRSYCRVMEECKAIQSFTTIKWDIRPRPDFGTIEVRACDAPVTLRDALALAALVRSLVITMQRLVDERPTSRRGDIRKQWIAVENRWLAIRHGLGATYIRTPSGKRRSLRQDLGEMIERLSPVASETGDLPYLRALAPVEKLETGAERQRRIYREAGTWEAVVQQAVAQLKQDLAELAPRPANATV